MVNMEKQSDSLIEQIIDHLNQIPDDEEGENNWLVKGISLLTEATGKYNLNTSDIFGFLLTVISWKRTGRTIPIGHQLFIQSYCKSNGLFQHVAQQLFMPGIDNYTRALNSPLNSSSSIFPSVKIDSTLAEINERGYAVLADLVPSDIVKELTVYAMNTAGLYRDLFEPGITDSRSTNVSLEKPLGVTFHVATEFRQFQTIASRLFTDPKILSIVSTYLDQRTVDLRQVSLWWSFPNLHQSNALKDDSAQMFHFDLDNLKWLKLFVYLTDVSEDQGPHCYISASQKPGTKPSKLLAKGYSRISDEEIIAHYDSHRIQYICGEAGTLFFGDTRCYHKGSRVITGNRLVLQAEYAINSLSRS